MCTNIKYSISILYSIYHEYLPESNGYACHPVLIPLFTKGLLMIQSPDRVNKTCDLPVTVDYNMCSVTKKLVLDVFRTNTLLRGSSSILKTTKTYLAGIVSNVEIDESDQRER